MEFDISIIENIVKTWGIEYDTGDKSFWFDKPEGSRSTIDSAWFEYDDIISHCWRWSTGIGREEYSGDMFEKGFVPSSEDIANKMFEDLLGIGFIPKS